MLRRFWLWLVGPPAECQACLEKVHLEDILQARIVKLETENKELVATLFRIGRLVKEPGVQEVPRTPVGGFKPLRQIRMEKEKAARMKANGTPAEKGWSTEELEKEVLGDVHKVQQHS